MRARLAIASAALAGAVITSAMLGVPGVDSARSRIREMEQRVIAANLALPAAAKAERQALERRDAAEARLAAITPKLARRASAQRAGQAVLARRLRDIYRDGDSDPFLTLLLSGGDLAGLAAQQSEQERVAQEDLAVVNRLKADRREMERLVRQRRDDLAEATSAEQEARAKRDEIVSLRDQRAADLRQARAALAKVQARAARADAAARARANAPVTSADTSAGTPAGGTWPAVPGGPSKAVLDRIAQCESGGNPKSIGGGGSFRGKYQFMTGTWEAMGGHGDPAAASEAEQDYRAALLFVREGPGQWPVCAAFAR